MRRGYGLWDRDHSSPRCPLRRQGSISERLPMCMRQLQEMDTCLRRYLRSWDFALPIRLRTPRPILSICSHRSRIRYRSGCGLQGQDGAGRSDGLMRA